MIIIRFTGALGNQLFQYSLYRNLRFLNKEVKADLRMFQKGIEKRIYYLSLLGITVEEALTNELDKYAQSFSKKDLFCMKTHYKYPYYEDNPVYCFQPKVLEMDNVYLGGYWQTEQYFSGIRDVLLKEMAFPKVHDTINLKIQDEIINSNSVAIHIRMGDYITLSAMYGAICTKEYYDQAIDYIRKRISNPVFYVFSDDVIEAKKLLGYEDFVWITGTSEEEAYYDMHLMSLCKHNIIANSSFSWWGAWLNQNSNKIVVAPNRWLNRKDTKDIWNKDWVKL